MIPLDYLSVQGQDHYQVREGHSANVLYLKFMCKHSSLVHPMSFRVYVILTMSRFCDYVPSTQNDVREITFRALAENYITKTNPYQNPQSLIFQINLQSFSRVLCSHYDPDKWAGPHQEYNKYTGLYCMYMM